MFERFTDRARKVVALANQEAQRFNHEYIGTEHLLLGIIKEGSGVGATVIKRTGIHLSDVRKELEKVVKPGPDCVTMGKLPQTAGAKKAIEIAIIEARNLGHNYVGTEHLLLGISQEDGIAAQVLKSLGLNIQDLREDILDMITPQTETPQTPQKCVEEDLFTNADRALRHVITGISNRATPTEINAALGALQTIINLKAKYGK